MICASIKEKKLSHALEKVSLVPEGYDLIEIWINEIAFDSFNELDDFFAEVMKNEKKILLKITNLEDLDVLNWGLKKNFEYIDIDYVQAKKSRDVADNPSRFKIENIKASLNEMKNSKLIFSYHDFDKTQTFESGLSLTNKMRESGADICKVIFKANKPQDNIVPLRLLDSCKFPMIAFCMGEIGRMSRIYASSFGSIVDFIPPDDNWITAEGQITYKEWKKITNKDWGLRKNIQKSLKSGNAKNASRI